MLGDLESLTRNHDYNDDQGSNEKRSAFALLSLKVNPLVTGLGQDHKLIDPLLPKPDLVLKRFVPEERSLTILSKH